MIALFFWLSLAGLAYIYVGYPLLISGLAKLRPMRRVRRDVPERVSMVIASYNDADRLERKVRDLLASEQSRWIEEIIVGSDGSTDDTVDRIGGIGDDRLRVVAFDERRGKPAVLNQLVPQCRCSIVVLCDARQELSDNAIPALTANFADPRVGIVSGELVFRQDDGQTTASRGLGAYWRYEKLIRRAEARFRGVPGVTGALYAIRRDLFQPIPESTLLDDVAIPMQVVAAGSHCVFESNAVAYDTPSQTPANEAIRKRRTIAGAAQLMRHHPAWLLPWKNPIWFEFVSHKVLRLASPLLLVMVAATNVALAAHPLYYGLLLLHAAFYVSAGAGWLFQRFGRPSLLFGVQLMFLTLNVTTVFALCDAARGRFRVTWQRV